MKLDCKVKLTLLKTAVAQGVIAQARVLGGSIAVATSTIIFNTKAQRSLTTVLSPSELEALLKSPSAITHFSLTQQSAVRLVFVDAFNKDMRTCTYVAAASLVVTLFMYQRHPPDLKGRLGYQEESRSNENDNKDRDN
jgi:hypothetical protein